MALDFVSFNYRNFQTCPKSREHGVMKPHGPVTSFDHYQHLATLVSPSPPPHHLLFLCKQPFLILWVLCLQAFPLGLQMIRICCYRSVCQLSDITY